MSSSHQAEDDRWGYARQREEIREYAERAKLDVVAEYKDSITGTTSARANLERLKRDAHQFGIVLISSVDRLARDVSTSYRVLAELLDLGLTIHSADFGPVDLEDDQSLIQFNLRSLFSHLERSKITRRTLAARVAMAASGKLPNGIGTYGYEQTPDGHAKADPTQASIVRRIFTEAAQGGTLRSIATRLNDEAVPVARPHRARGERAYWHYSTIGQILRNAAYRGEYEWTHAGRTYTIPIPPLVTEDEWFAAQPRKRGPPSTSGWLLIGHARCGQCGSRLRAKTHTRTLQTGETRRHEYYACQGVDRANIHCDQKRFVRADAERAVETAVRHHLTRPDVAAALLGAAAQQARPDLDARRADLEREKTDLLTAFRRRIISVDELEQARREVDQALAALRPEPPDDLPVQAFVQAAATLPVGDALERLGLVAVLSSDEVRFTLA